MNSFSGTVLRSGQSSMNSGISWCSASTFLDTYLLGDVSLIGLVLGSHKQRAPILNFPCCTIAMPRKLVFGLAIDQVSVCLHKCADMSSHPRVYIANLKSLAVILNIKGRY